jgi:hypothetical protein
MDFRLPKGPPPQALCEELQLPVVNCAGSVLQIISEATPNSMIYEAPNYSLETVPLKEFITEVFLPGSQLTALFPEPIYFW